MNQYFNKYIKPLNDELGELLEGEKNEQVS
jgi:hypothetical protein